MNKNLFATVIAAAGVAVGGIAVAQSPSATPSTSDVPPKTSTPGAGCTATGNAMSAGNLGGDATNKPCNAPVSAAPAPTATTGAVAAPAPSSADTSTASSASTPPASTTADAGTGSTNVAPAPAPTRVARADRG